MKFEGYTFNDVLLDCSLPAAVRCRTFSKAWARSSIISVTFSIPTDKRTNPGITPAAFCSSSDSC